MEVPRRQGARVAQRRARGSALPCGPRSKVMSQVQIWFGVGHQLGAVVGETGVVAGALGRSAPLGNSAVACSHDHRPAPGTELVHEDEASPETTLLPGALRRRILVGGLAILVVRHHPSYKEALQRKIKPKDCLANRGGCYPQSGRRVSDLLIIDATAGRRSWRWGQRASLAAIRWLASGVRRYTWKREVASRTPSRSQRSTVRERMPMNIK